MNYLEYIQQLKHLAAEFSGTNSCIDNDRKAALFDKFRYLFGDLQNKYYNQKEKSVGTRLKNIELKLNFETDNGDKGNIKINVEEAESEYDIGKLLEALKNSIKIHIPEEETFNA